MKKNFCVLLTLFILKGTFAQNSSTALSGTKQKKKSQVCYLEGYKGATGCERPMTSREFEEYKSYVLMRYTDEDKILASTESIFSYCLLCSQAKELMDVFGFEETKLHFAKLVYRHIYDVDDYYTIAEVFEFQKTIDDFEEFINVKNKKE
jgi:hypothetical protein